MNELSFFKCGNCGSNVLRATKSAKLKTAVESVLPCKCGETVVAALRSELISAAVKQHGWLRDNRAIGPDRREEIVETGRDKKDKVSCGDCYKKNAGKLHLWKEARRTVQADQGEPDLTISCEGCGRQIEFGFAHRKSKGPIFLAEGDKDFQPWRIYPDPKYVDKWRERGWLRPMSPEEAAERLKLPVEQVVALINQGKLPRHKTAPQLTTDRYAVKAYLARPL